MTLYSKNGSIPKPQTDATEGWIEVSEPPLAPEGMETVWWYPPGWVIRPKQPEAESGHKWSWSQTEQQWNKYPLPTSEVVTIAAESTTGTETSGAETINI